MPRFEYRNLSPTAEAEKTFLTWIDQLDQQFMNRDAEHRSQVVPGPCPRVDHQATGPRRARGRPQRIQDRREVTHRQERGARFHRGRVIGAQSGAATMLLSLVTGCVLWPSKSEI